MTDVLPGSVTYVSATPSLGSCSGTTTVTCNLGTMSNGAQATVSLIVRPTTAGTVTNTVTGENRKRDNGAGWSAARVRANALNVTSLAGKMSDDNPFYAGQR